MLGEFVLIALVWTIIVLLGYINKLKKAYLNLKEENKALRSRTGVYWCGDYRE